ncbi:MAG TPA: hypothetical protein VKQ30_20900 [Ktedonobacterales bacterium]|nr:hypothetical protein [Ktedonobacterales bacterium]
MDLASLLIQNGAPLIGGLLKTAASAAGGPVVGALAGVVIDAVAKAVGAPSSEPSAIAAAIAADPAKAAAAIPQVEAAHAELIKAQTDAQEAAFKDVEDARATTVQLVAQKSIMAWGAVVVSVLVVLAFLAALVLLVRYGVDANNLSGQAELILTGTLGAAFAQVVNYWLGSSSGSSDKTAALTSLAHASVQPPAVIVKARGK